MNTPQESIKRRRTKDPARRQRVIPDIPPGTSPGEYFEKVLKLYREFTHQHPQPQEYSVGSSQGGNNSGDSYEVLEMFDRITASMSYFIADQLITLGAKEARYREDAVSDRWLDETEKLMRENGCPELILPAQMEAGIRICLDQAHLGDSDEPGPIEHVRTPLDLGPLGLSAAIGKARRGPVVACDPPPRRAPAVQKLLDALAASH